MQTYKIQDRIMTQNDCYKAGKRITPKGIMVHSVGCKGTTFARWQQWDAPGIQKCVHFFIDGAGIYRTLPDFYRGWHAGGSANNTHIGFEICEPQTDTPENRDDLYSKTLYLCVTLCKTYGLDAGSILTHCEGHARGMASNHADVNHWWGKGVWQGYTMDRLRADVAAALGETPAAQTVTVQKGDTLRKIAAAHGTNWQTLADVNGLQDPYIIHPGQMLRLPGAVWQVTRLLKKGCSGRDAAALQERLNAAGFACGSVDGIFGTKTEQAVRAFQQSRSLTVDGLAGKHTVTALGGVWMG